MNFKSFKHCHRPSLAFWSKEAVTHECPWDSVLLTSSGGTTVGSVEVLSLVSINSCQVSLLGGFHPNSSLETTEGLLASQQASRSLTIADSPGDGGRDAGGGVKTSLYWFYTNAHATVDQSAAIAPDTWHAANKADKHGRMRETASESRRRRGTKREREWMLEHSEWQATHW